MNLISEHTAYTRLSETIVKAGVSLFNAVKYVYAISERDYYNISVKDIFRIALADITDANALYNTGIRVDKDNCAAMSGAEYEKVLSLMVYSFAVRLPLLRRIKTKGGVLSDKQIKAVYDMAVEKGAENYQNAIDEDFDENRRLVRMGRQLPPFDAEWYKSYIYTYVPELSAINNRNLFLAGSVDVLFALYYSRLNELLESLLSELSEK